MIQYVKLNKYKYRLIEDYDIQTIIKDVDVLTNYLHLRKSGLLTVFKGYAWDGPSGPTVDTKNFMRASLVHDVLYQLLRSGELEQKYKGYVDTLMRKINIEDGMSKFRAWYTYLAVNKFGKKNAKIANSKKEIQIAP